MSRWPMRMRVLDLVVATTCVACVCAPLLAIAHAASSDETFIEDGATVDQRVVEVGTISNPLNGTFDRSTSGVADGSVQWDTYTTARRGLKLVLTTDDRPAMSDPASGANVDDAQRSTEPWSVPAGGREFGISSKGAIALRGYGSGAQWRGLNGGVSVEVARSDGPTPATRTTIPMRAEFKRSLGGSARPAAHVIATAVINL